MSSVWTYKKNKAILNAGKTKPISGTRMEGKKDAAIIRMLICIIKLIIYPALIIYKSKSKNITNF